MALQGKLNKENKSNSYKTTFEKAYFRADDVFIDLSNNRVRAHIRGYAEEYARHNNATGVYKKVVYVPLKNFEKVLCTKGNILEVVYTYLKTLDEFKHLKDHKIKYKGKIDIEPENDDEIKSVVSEEILEQI
jgi:hypothetical protein